MGRRRWSELELSSIAVHGKFKEIPSLNGNYKVEDLSGTRLGDRMLTARLPSLLASKSLVQQCKNLRNTELNIFQVKLFLVVLLHFK